MTWYPSHGAVDTGGAHDVVGSHCHLLAGRDDAKQDTRAAGRRALTACMALRAADHGLRLPPYVLLRHER